MRNSSYRNCATMLRKMEHMLDLDDIRAFVEVAEAGGFGRAGPKLGMSKSIVSRRVARLEAELGAQLLSRTTRGVSVTEAGMAFKERAERALAELEGARDDLAERGEEIMGRLRISAPLSFGLTHLAPVLAELAVRHPRLSLDVAYSDRFVDLIGEQFDAAIRIGALQDSSLIARRISPIKTMFIASPAYLAAHGTPRTPRDLQRHAAVIYGAETWRLREGRRMVSIRPEGRVRMDNGQAIVEAVKAGLGVALIPTFLCGAAIESGAVVPILLDYPTPDAALHVVRPPPAQHAPAKVRALIDLMLERFGGEPYWDACYRAGARAKK